MKKFIIKIATYAFLAGFIFSAIGIWNIIKERNVSSDVRVLNIDSVTDPKEELIYATIDGGTLDITRTYELSLKRKKSDVNLSTNYYTPVVHGDDASVIYIVKSDVEPTINDLLKPLKYTGLLQSKSEMPEKILTAYEEDLPQQSYFYLDSTYKSKTVVEKLKGDLLFICLMFGGLIVRLLLTRSPKQTTEQPLKQDNA